MEELTGFEELNQIETELQENFFADTTKCCGTGTCS
jgi:hypothetical protein